MILILYVCWIIFNSNITIEIALLGLMVAGLVYAFMWKFLDFTIRKELLLFRLSGFMLMYFGILVIEIVKASLATISIIFDERVEVCPVLVEFDVDIKSDVLKVILANSITMTPGTITVSLVDNHYVVHSLDESFAVDIDKSIFVEKLLVADRYLEKCRGEK